MKKSMMRKIGALLLSSFALFSAVACGGGDDGTAAVSNKVLSINRFETHADLDTLTLNGILGKVQLNEEKTYIKEGAASAKITVIADPYKSAQPYLFQAMNLEKQGVDCTDFADVEHVTMSVYNSQSETKRVGMQMVFTDSYNKGITEWFELKPTAWTTVKYTIAREFIPENKKSDGTKAYLVTGMNIIFDRPQADETFYLDEMKVYKTDKAFTPVKMTLAKDEICSFDKLWQVQKLGFECYDGAELVPNVSYVKDNTATGKGAALRMETVPGPGAGRWPGIVLNEEMLTLVDWASYDDNDRLCFDVYTPAINALDMVYLNLYVNGVRYAMMEGVSLKRGEWITVSYTVKELNDCSPSSSMDFSRVTGVKLFYLEHAGSPKIAYIDNFRMERVD